MAARVATVDFQGIEARRVDVEVQFTSGEVFIVSMGDKAISESRERVGAAFSDLGLSLPGRRIIANLAPAYLPKEGSRHGPPSPGNSMMAARAEAAASPRAAGPSRSGWPAPSPTWRDPKASVGCTSPRR